MGKIGGVGAAADRRGQFGLGAGGDVVGGKRNDAAGDTGVLAQTPLQARLPHRIRTAVRRLQGVVPLHRFPRPIFACAHDAKRA
ncbi:MAG: hypothetical protein MZV65_29840 [Chromatiales bacterium]|nr:hypothetical protein [Chromatiales bacterium]